MLLLEGVSKSYDGGQSHAVRQIYLDVEEGELLVLLGESGCGKTTTLKMINRLIEPTEGTIRVQGEDTRDGDPVTLRRKIGYVFQGIGLFPHFTVGENIAVVPNLLGWGDADVEQRVDELLELVGLQVEDFRERRPTELSGGQQQRIGLARALAARPKIMLMDEPFGALDPLTRDRLQDEFTGIHRNLGLTTVMVTHDMTEALLLADRIAVMNEGRILRVDTPRELLNDPQDPYIQDLMDMPRRQADRLEDLMHKAEESR
jgi:osmoprotectant transport system ATP-binding protein